MKLIREKNLKNEVVIPSRERIKKVLPELTRNQAGSSHSSDVASDEPVSKKITWKNVEEPKLKIVLAKRQISAKLFRGELSNVRLVKTETNYMFNKVEQYRHESFIPYRELSSADYGESSSIFLYIEQNGPLSILQAQKWFHQLVDIVDFYHKKRYPLRNISLQHLFVDSEENLKLCYFEYPEQFTIQWGPKRQVKRIWGSPVFAAPEAITCENYNPFKADIWSLGVVLYAFMNGSLPFVGDLRGYCKSPEEIYTGILSQVSVDSREPVGFLARDLLDHMLAKQCELRIHLWNIKAHPWITEYCESVLNPPGETASIGRPEKSAFISPNRSWKKPITPLYYPFDSSTVNEPFIYPSVDMNESRESPDSSFERNSSSRSGSPVTKDSRVSKDGGNKVNTSITLSPVKPLLLTKRLQKYHHEFKSLDNLVQPLSSAPVADPSRCSPKPPRLLISPKCGDENLMHARMDQENLFLE